MKEEIGVFILNDKKEILLQKRSADKEYFPNKWALCTGHVEKGETPEVAALREMNEELGLVISMEELYPYFTIERDNHTSYFYYIKCNLEEEKFIIQEEELSLVKWFNIDEVISMIQNKDERIVYSANKVEWFEKLKKII